MTGQLHETERGYQAAKEQAASLADARDTYAADARAAATLVAEKEAMWAAAFQKGSAELEAARAKVGSRPPSSKPEP